MLIRTGLAAAGLLAAAACGSTPSAPPVAGSTGHVAAFASPGAATAAQSRRAWLDFTACMRAHGANLPDPSFNQEGRPQWPVSPKTQSPDAFKACQSHLQGVTGGGVPVAPTAAELAQETRFARCMRQHGIASFPDPDPQTGAFTSSSLDKHDPVLQIAAQACAQFAPKGKG